MPAPAGQGNDSQAVQLLLASSRDWFASALQAVLEPEGFGFAHVRSAEAALQEVSGTDPDVVIIDEGLPEMPAAELCRRLLLEDLSASVPILVYSPNFWHETEQAEAMRAGAWDVIREPIRSRLLVAKLKRLLHLKGLIESAEESTLADPETGLYSMAGLVHALPILGSVAQRSGSPLSCAVLGPTQPAASAERLGHQRRETAALVRSHTRASDLCAAIGGADIAFVAYNATVETTTAIVRRLSEQAERSAEFVAEIAPLSAGITPFPAGPFTRRPGAETADAEAGPAAVAERVARLSRLAEAQSALRDARSAGGGIRITTG